MYECNLCGYKTKRSYNYNLHVNRKTPCKPKVIDLAKIKHEGLSVNSQGDGDSNDKGGSFKDKTASKSEGLTQICEPIGDVNKCNRCYKAFSRKSGLAQHSKICVGVKTIHCPICLKIFSSPQTKYEHKKNVKCKPPIDVPETVQEENERLKKEAKLMSEEIETLKLRPTTINNTTNNNTDNSTNINVIQYNNYDKPYTDHITNTVMKGIFETSQRDPALILNETVRRIYKNDKHPENNVIKMGEKTALSKVFKDGKEIWLPMDGVIQTVLSNTGEFCADRIRDCHEEGVIIGDRARYVWQLMEVLGTDDREDDCLNRSSYIQSVKSAFL